MEELKDQIHALQQQMQQMREAHEQKVQALEKEITNMRNTQVQIEPRIAESTMPEFQPVHEEEQVHETAESREIPTSMTAATSDSAYVEQLLTIQKRSKQMRSSK